ncbi:hypothetical protein FRC18_005924 [Serendipita sp. 400]|nr:hypothetical protein FRC18_005924 [Serendipita sp. 400]
MIYPMSQKYNGMTMSSGNQEVTVDPLVSYAHQLHQYTRRQWLEARRQVEKEAQMHASAASGQYTERKHRKSRSSRSSMDGSSTTATATSTALQSNGKRF